MNAFYFHTASKQAVAYAVLAVSGGAANHTIYQITGLRAMAKTNPCRECVVRTSDSFSGRHGKAHTSISLASSMMKPGKYKNQYWARNWARDGSARRHRKTAICDWPILRNGRLLMQG